MGRRETESKWELDLCVICADRLSNVRQLFCQRAVSMETVLTLTWHTTFDERAWAPPGSRVVDRSHET